MASRDSGVLGLALLALASTLAPIARAACPQTYCDCFGQAGQYSIVATESARLIWGTYRSEGSTVYESANVAGLCTTAVSLKGIEAGVNTAGSVGVGTLVALAGAGSEAVRATSVGDDFQVFVNLLVTGGGALVGADEAEVDQLDTSGTHAQLATCTQAMADIRSASQTLAALPPTLDYGSIVLTGDEQLDIDVGPGVTVIEADKIVLRASPLSYPPRLRINTVPETEAVIVNTEQFSAGYASEVQGSRAIINVVGAGPSVRLTKYSGVAVPILAAERTVKITVPFTVMSRVYARRVFVRGGLVNGAGCF
jgi:hypothetical protein